MKRMTTVMMAIFLLSPIYLFAQEQVDAPKFQNGDLKLTRDITSSVGSSTTGTYYYSPDAKSIVKMLFEFPDGPQTVELIKLGAGQ